MNIKKLSCLSNYRDHLNLTELFENLYLNKTKLIYLL